MHCRRLCWITNHEKAPSRVGHCSIACIMRRGLWFFRNEFSVGRKLRVVLREPLGILPAD
jgi:hypothetical protein